MTLGEMREDLARRLFAAFLSFEMGYKSGMDLSLKTVREMREMGEPMDQSWLDLADLAIAAVTSREGRT